MPSSEAKENKSVNCFSLKRLLLWHPVVIGMSKGAIWSGFHHAQPFSYAEAAKITFKEDLARGDRKPWYHPYDAGFACIINAEVVESW